MSLRRSRPWAAGFTFAEMLVVMALAGIVLVAAILAFQAIGTFQSNRSSYETITFANNTVMANFYGANTNALATWTAPSYGHLARVELMRDKFYEDIQKSVAVYCLPRSGLSTFRTNVLNLPSGYEVGAYDFRRLSTPELFRQFLASSSASLASAFDTNAFAMESGAVRGRNLSIAMLRKSTSYSSLNVHCIYEVDFVRPASPGGVYASVRRYQGATLTDYYDAFYADVDGASEMNSDHFYVAANFERAVRPASSASVTNVAAGQPFYFVWWPDPATRSLPAASSGYTNAMRDQTSLLMVVPMFPAL